MMTYIFKHAYKSHGILRLLHSSGHCSVTPIKSIKDGPDLSHFLLPTIPRRKPKISPSFEKSNTYLTVDEYDGKGRTVKLFTYGCQMNVNDMEVVRSILLQSNYKEIDDLQNADVVLLMTCSIREGAEEKVWRELRRIKSITKGKPVVGILGCMAERLRDKFFDRNNLCDIVAGPDSYRDLPRLLAISRTGQNAINVQLSLEETYAEVAPVRQDSMSKTAFVSIMRGCDNMCSYCIVPYTRGKERSRPIDSILAEVKRLSDEGIRQVILLGQNVNSYRDLSESSFSLNFDGIQSIPEFRTVYKPKSGGRSFVTLLDLVSRIDPEMRIRFTSPHPKDFQKPVLSLIAERTNICKQIHLPAQSGNNAVLERMGRGYTRELYLSLVDEIRRYIPEIFLTSDFIAGFCGEDEDAHQATIDLIKRVSYDFCYVFPYSMREKTKAFYRLDDDVPEDVKKRRHEELAFVFREEAAKFHKKLEGSTQLILVEGESKRSKEKLFGRIDGGTKTIIDKILKNGESFQSGDYVEVKITSSNSQTLFAHPIARSTLAEWARKRL